MRVGLRLGVSVLIVGLALIVAAELTPGATIVNQTTIGSEIPGTFFLAPSPVSISISSLNGSAMLVVSPLGYNVSELSPIVNISVVSKDIVTFQVPARGYYDVGFESVSGSSGSVSYSVSEGGVPQDLVYGGALIAVAGAVVSGFAWAKARRESTKQDALATEFVLSYSETAAVDAARYTGLDATQS